MGRNREDAAPVFHSKDERDRWQIQQYGAVRDGFRTELERTDERPLLYYPYQFWEPGEEEIWLRAVRLCPVKEYGHLDVFRYLAEVSALATGLDVNKGKYGVKAMPEARR